MSTERVDRATHHDSTDPVSVTTHARERECNGSSALGEVSVEGLSDRGSTPLASTNTILHKTLLLCRRLCRDGLVCVISDKSQRVFALWLFLLNSFSAIEPPAMPVRIKKL